MIDESELRAREVASELKEVDGELRKIIDESDDDLTRIINESESRSFEVISKCNAIDGELSRIIDEKETRIAEVTSVLNKVDGELRIIDEREQRSCVVTSESEEIDGELWKIFDARESSSAEVKSELNEVDELRIISDSKSRSCGVTSESEEIDGEHRKINDESESGSADVKLELSEAVGEQRLINEIESLSCEVASEPIYIDAELWKMIHESESQSSEVKSELNEVDGELQQMIDESESHSNEATSELKEVDIYLQKMIDESESRSNEATSELKEVDIYLQKMIDESQSQSGQVKSEETDGELLSVIDENESRGAEVEPELIKVGGEFRDSRISNGRECLLSLEKDEFDQEIPIVDSLITRDLRISYTRECLLSLAEEDICRKLPSGFDLSIISELKDICNSAPENLKLRGHEPLSTCSGPGATARKSSERWDIYKFSSIDTGGAFGAATRESCDKWDSFNSSSVTTYTGGAFGATTKESSERWNSFKLSSIDDKSTGTMGMLDSSSQVPECGGILGSWSGIMSTPNGCEMSTLERQGTKGLLSRCSEPYRPPFFYKALSHTGMQSHDSCENETLPFAKAPTKQRATEDRWRKDSSGLAANRDLQASKEKKKLSECDDNLKPKVDTCLMVGEQSLSNSNDSPPISPDNCLKDLSNHQPPLQVEKLTPQILEGGRFSALINLEGQENVDPDLNDGFHVSLHQQTAKRNVIADTFAQKVQPFKTNLAPNDKFQSGWRVMLDGVGSDHIQKGSRSHAASIAKSKENKTRNVFHVNTAGEGAGKSSAVEVSVSLGSSVKPSLGTSYLLGASVPQQRVGVDNAAKGLRKSCTALTSGTHQSAMAANLSNGSEPEIWQSSHCTKSHDIVMDSRDIHKSHSKFIHWFSDNDNGAKNISSGGDQTGHNIWRGSSGMLQKGNLLGQRQSKEESLYVSKPAVSERTRTGVQEYGNSWSIERNNCFLFEMSHNSLHSQAPGFAEVSRHKYLGDASAEISNSQVAEGSRFSPMSDIGDQADINSELNLPDEDSLITIDDTFILELDVPKPSSNIPSRGGRSTSVFPCTKKSMRSRSFHQNSSLPNLWFNKSQMNVQKLFGGSPDTPDHSKLPHALQDPWKISHGKYDVFPADAASMEQLPLMPKTYELALQRPSSPRMQQTQSFYPFLGNNFLAGPSMYPNVHRNPFCQQPPDLLGSHHLDYNQRNVEPTYVGKKGFFAEDGTRPSFSQVLQLKMKMAQMNN